jgi:hypothetical protein
MRPNTVILYRLYAGNKANAGLDHMQVLTPETLQWCEYQWTLLGHPERPQANDFISRQRNADGTFIKAVPTWLQQLIYTARAHHDSGLTPALSIAPKPHSDAFTVRKEVIEASRAAHD